MSNPQPPPDQKHSLKPGLKDYIEDWISQIPKGEEGHPPNHEPWEPSPGVKDGETGLRRWWKKGGDKKAS